jgi:hypothetical protein
MFLILQLQLQLLSIIPPRIAISPVGVGAVDDILGRSRAHRSFRRL